MAQRHSSGFTQNQQPHVLKTTTSRLFEPVEILIGTSGCIQDLWEKGILSTRVDMKRLIIDNVPQLMVSPEDEDDVPFMRCLEYIIIESPETEVLVLSTPTTKAVQDQMDQKYIARLNNAVVLIKWHGAAADAKSPVTEHSINIADKDTQRYWKDIFTELNVSCNARHAHTIQAYLHQNDLVNEGKAGTKKPFFLCFFERNNESLLMYAKWAATFGEEGSYSVLDSGKDRCTRASTLAAFSQDSENAGPYVDGETRKDMHVLFTTPTNGATDVTYDCDPTIIIGSLSDSSYNLSPIEAYSLLVSKTGRTNEGFVHFLYDPGSDRDNHLLTSLAQFYIATGNDIDPYMRELYNKAALKEQNAIDRSNNIDQQERGGNRRRWD